jgi:hypothetical protein
LILKQQAKVWIILISLWIINGSSFLAIKVAIDTIPPMLSAGLRFSISGAILFAVYFFQVKRTEHRSGHHHGNNPQQLQYQEQELQKKILLNTNMNLRLIHHHYLRIHHHHHLHMNISASNNGNTAWFLD